jgi:hypothetical protein
VKSRYISPAEYAQAGWHYKAEHRSAKWITAAVLAVLCVAAYWAAA